MIIVLSIAAVSLAKSQPAASDSLLRQVLQAHRYTLNLAGEELSGDGAEFLNREAQMARFFMIGEEHGIADVPELTAALFRSLRPHGYQHLVIETSPTTARLLERAGRSGIDSLTALFGRYPLAVPFYASPEEALLLVEVLEDAGQEQVLWGVDYEFVLGASLALGELARRASSEEAQALSQHLLRSAEAGERAAVGGDRSGLFFTSIDSQDFEELRATFAGDEDALELIDALEASSAAWRLQFSGENYLSNVKRTDLMKRHFARSYERAKGDRDVGPKAILKFGANHLYRGRTPVNVFDVGTLATMIAQYEGGDSFNVMVAGGPGTEHAFFNPTQSGTREVQIAPWARPLYEAAGDEDWAVLDLRPLRPLVHSDRLQLTAELEQLVWGYDAFLVLAGSRPATIDSSSDVE